MEINLEEVIQSVEKLPTLNSVAFRVLQLCSDIEIPIPKLVKVVSGDQSLTTQILKVANSSYFNYPRTIYSLDRAIVILGFNLLRDIAVSLSIFSIYSKFRLNDYIDARALWRHSLYTGFTLKTLSENYDSENTEILYVGGLLHDIGKLVLVNALPQDYAYLIEKQDTEKKNRLVDLEKKFFGITHAEIGAKLIERWKLPRSIVDMVRYHHDPDEIGMEENHRQWARLLYIGNIFAHLVESRESDISNLVKLEPHFMDHVTFNNTTIKELVKSVEEEIGAQQEYIKLFETG